MKVAFVFLLSFITGLVYAQPRVVTYSYPANWPSSQHYKVTVNDQEIFVNQAPTAAYAIFDFAGPVTIKIKPNRDVKWVDIRPLKRNIKSTIKNDSTITFTLDKPGQVSVEVNGRITMPLYVFASAIEKDKPAKGKADVIYYEGGKIHDIGLLKVNSNQTVYVEGGAIVRGAIHAANGKNVRIRGRGILDGTENILVKDQYRHFVQLKDCEDVEVSGVTFHNGTTWQVVPLHSNRVLIDDIKIISDNASDDGIDVARSRNVTITNSFIRTKDDCIAIKANFDYPPGEIVENIFVRNCVFWNAMWGNAIEIGFELRAKEVKNIEVKDCDIIHVEAGAAISIHNADQSTVHNILFEDIRIEDARQKLFDVAILLSQYSIDGPKKEERKQRYLEGAWDGVTHVPAEKISYHAQYRGYINNITFRNISIVDGLFPFSIFYGFSKEHLVKNVVIENLTVHGRKIKSKPEAKIYEENTSNIVVK